MPSQTNDNRARAAAVDLIKMDALGLGEDHASEITPIVMVFVTYCLEYGQGINAELRQALLDKLDRFDELRQTLKVSVEGGDLEKRRPKLAYKMTSSRWRTNFPAWAATKLPEVAALVAAKEQEACANSTAPSSGRKRRGEAPQSIPIEALVPHPDNPRLAFNHDLVKALAVQMRKVGRFEARHAITVRWHKGKWQILSGHTRVEAAKQAGLTLVMAWIVEVPDEEALLLLALDNQQEPLSALELAIHSFKVVDRTKDTLTSFAKKVGLQSSNLSRYRHGAKVYFHVVSVAGGPDNFIKCRDLAEHLAAIKKAPQEQWVALVEACLEKKWSKNQAERAAEAAARGEDWHALDKPTVDDALVRHQQAEDAADKTLDSRSSTVDVTSPDESESTVAESSPPESAFTSEVSSHATPPVSLPGDPPGSEAAASAGEGQGEELPDAEERQPRAAGTKLKSAVTSVKNALEQLSTTNELMAHLDLLHDLLAQLQRALSQAASVTP